jgi:3-hydroxyisobutyrate dehydrogenase-like beta-hydroxyacid dehydrogenase
MLDRTFEDARAPIRTYLKDLGLVQELARSLGVPTPACDLAFQQFTSAAGAGLGDLDVAGIVLPLEQQAGVEIRRQD